MLVLVVEASHIWNVQYTLLTRHSGIGCLWSQARWFHCSIFYMKYLSSFHVSPNDIYALIEENCLQDKHMQLPLKESEWICFLGWYSWVCVVVCLTVGILWWIPKYLQLILCYALSESVQINLFMQITFSGGKIGVMKIQVQVKCVFSNLNDSMILCKVQVLAIVCTTIPFVRKK